MEFCGEVRDRRVGAPELLQHAASSGVRQRSERGVEAGFIILNHMVQYKRIDRGPQQEVKALTIPIPRLPAASLGVARPRLSFWPFILVLSAPGAK